MKKMIDTGFVYAPYIPLQTSPSVNSKIPFSIGDIVFHPRLGICQIGLFNESFPWLVTLISIIEPIETVETVSSDSLRLADPVEIVRWKREYERFKNGEPCGEI